MVGQSRKKVLVRESRKDAGGSVEDEEKIKGGKERVGGKGEVRRGESRKPRDFENPVTEYSSTPEKWIRRLLRIHGTKS